VPLLDLSRLADSDAGEEQEDPGYRCPNRACGLAFTSLTGFDDHRAGRLTGEFGTGGQRHRTEAGLRARGYEPSARGLWRIPRPGDSRYWEGR
jgi:hypothetical protein